MIGSGYDRAGAPEAPMGPRVRVYELAKDLGLQPKDLVAKVRAMSIDVANHMSQIEPGDVDRIRRAVERERHESLVEERLTVDGTVIRRRSKVAPVAPARPAAPAAVAPPPAAAPKPQPVAPAPAAPEPVVVKPVEPVEKVVEKIVEPPRVVAPEPAP
ncbi:MAG TPA: translation initiation factor IF-2 N-terminal domain-containing protein, partial [Polyangia bacterium]|nr:translation initiation factor IF-2 N-terminal domain-containing protein [Polyangia bacterium]